MSAALKAIETTKALSKVFGQINKLEGIENDILALLPQLSDDEVMETRNYAKLLGKSAWRIEIACDAEIWNRTYAKRGRGNIDVEEKGIKATVAKRAAELGCTPRTIEQNARVFKLVRDTEKNDENVFTILEEKGFWQAALAAPNPNEALEHFAEEKSSNPMFSVRDAFRWSDGQKKPSPAVSVPKGKEIESLHGPEVQAFLCRYIATLKEFEESVPTTARFLRQMIQAHTAQAHWQKTRNVEDDCAVIMLAIKESGDSIAEDDLYQWLMDHGYFMSDPEFEERLDYMERDDVKMAKRTDAGHGKQEERRGKLPVIVRSWFNDFKHLKIAQNDEDED